MESVDKDVMSGTATAISNQWREPWKKSENNHREVEPSEELVSSECKKKKKNVPFIFWAILVLIIWYLHPKAS